MPNKQGDKERILHNYLKKIKIWLNPSEKNSLENFEKPIIKIKNGKTTDFVKLLNSFYDLGYLQNFDNNDPITKDMFISYFQAIIEIKNFHQSLNQSFKSDKINFLAVFKKLEENASNLYDEKLDK